MTEFLMGLKTVEYVREVRHGDRGFNPAKGRMVIINVPGSGWRSVPFDALKAVDLPEPAAPAVKPGPAVKPAAAPAAAPAVRSRRGRR